MALTLTKHQAPTKCREGEKGGEEGQGRRWETVQRRGGVQCLRAGAPPPRGARSHARPHRSGSGSPAAGPPWAAPPAYRAAPCPSSCSCRCPSNSNSYASRPLATSPPKTDTASMKSGT
eukprot:1604843-Rhodomonas_salina.3